MPNLKLDHCVIHVSDWERCERVLSRRARRRGGQARPARTAYRFGDTQLNLHGPGVTGGPVARLPVQPGNSDLCFEWDGPIAGAIEHLKRCAVADRDRARCSALGRERGRAPASISAIPTVRCSSSFLPRSDDRRPDRSACRSENRAEHLRASARRCSCCSASNDSYRATAIADRVRGAVAERCTPAGRAIERPHHAVMGDAAERHDRS